LEQPAPRTPATDAGPSDLSVVDLVAAGDVERAQAAAAVVAERLGR
jgi:hypothetical protein